MRWTWDNRKDAANRAKHGLSLSLVPFVLDDPLALSVPDSHPDGDRWRTTGRVAGRILMAVHTWPDDER